MSQSSVPNLRGKVALIAGGSRGCGKGAALGLGEAGATVYITGRTLDPGTGELGLAGSLAETAEAVTALGGKGIPVQCDHGDDAAVESVFRRIRDEHGRLDVLVNSCHTRPDCPFFNVPFWEQPRELWDTMHRIGL